MGARPTPATCSVRPGVAPPPPAAIHWPTASASWSPKSVNSPSETPWPVRAFGSRRRGEGASADPEPLSGRARADPARADGVRSVSPGERRVRVGSVHGPGARPGGERSGRGHREAFARDRDVLRDDLRPGRPPAVKNGGARRRADAGVGIQHQVARVGRREKHALDQLDRELAGMGGLLDVVRLHVREGPHVPGVLAQRVAGVRAGALALPPALARILLRHADGIEVEHRLASLGEPEQHLVASRETLRAVQSVLEVPHDTIAQDEFPVLLEDGVEDHVERDDLLRRDVVADLPADAAAGPEHAHALVDHLALALEVALERGAPPALVRLVEMVRRRRDDELHAAVRHGTQQVERVALVEADVGVRIPPRRHAHRTHATTRGRDGHLAGRYWTGATNPSLSPVSTSSTLTRASRYGPGGNTTKRTAVVRGGTSRRPSSSWRTRSAPAPGTSAASAAAAARGWRGEPSAATSVRSDPSMATARSVAFRTVRRTRALPLPTASLPRSRRCPYLSSDSTRTWTPDSTTGVSTSGRCTSSLKLYPNARLNS